MNDKDREKLTELVLYTICGVMTTAINIFVFWLLALRLGIWYVASNAAAWFIAFIFAFVVNKYFVFRSRSWARGIWLREFAQFAAARVGTGLLDMLLIWLMISVISLDEMFSKVTSNVVVIVANYVLSKLWIFKGK